MHHACLERSRRDAPAAVPLIGYIAGLLLGPSIVNPRSAIVALLVCAAAAACFRFRRWLDATLIALSLAGGLAAVVHQTGVRLREGHAFESIDTTRFARIEGPLSREWSPMGDSFLLRVDRFRANGIAFARPLLIYARFEPPPFGMQATIRAGGFLRRNERGAYTLTVKSPRLIAYRGELSPVDPERWNRALMRRITPLASDHADAVALANAVALGRSERLTASLRESFRRGGTYHLLVFSGLQIAVAAGALAWLLRCLYAPRASDWMLLLFAILAPFFIGPTASVSRASIGIGVYALSRILHRPTSIENLWCIAAFLRLVIAPDDLFEVSFQLTYAGAGALLFIAKRMPRTRWRWLAAAGATELAITPLTLFHFHQYALGGSLLTLVLTPVIFAMLIASGLLFGFPCEPLIRFIDGLHHLCVVLNAAGAPTSGFFNAPPKGAVAIGFALSLVAIALFQDRWRSIVIIAALSIPLTAALLRAWAMRSVEQSHIIALDVGQGDAIVIRSGRAVALVDGGGHNDDARFGVSELLPLLADRGIRRIDTVLLTHAHPDHCGGLPAVVRNLDVGEVWISPRRFAGTCAQEMLAACSDRMTPIHLVRDRDRFSVGAIRGTALLAQRSFKRSPENNSSVVLRLEIGRRRVLLTGDIEREAEWSLIGRDLHADILKVAHHGSRSSSTPEFLVAVNPRIALVSCGRHNLFGHPHAAVLEALRERRITLWRTDRSGTIDVGLISGQVVVQAEIDTPQ